MTDARLRGEWLTELWHKKLSDNAVLLLNSGLMWSAQHGTDGFIEAMFVPELRPRGYQAEAIEELVGAGIVEWRDEGIQFLDWDGKLGQSTAAHVAAIRANNAERKRRERERKESSSSSVTPDVTRDVTADVGEGLGEGDQLKKKGKNSDNPLLTASMRKTAADIAPDIDLVDVAKKYAEFIVGKDVNNPDALWRKFLENAQRDVEQRNLARSTADTDRETRLRQSLDVFDAMRRAEAEAEADPAPKCIHGRTAVVCPKCDVERAVDSNMASGGRVWPFDANADATPFMACTECREPLNSSQIIRGLLRHPGKCPSAHESQVSA